MQSTALLRTLTLGLALASALPQTALAGHEQLVAQHRLTRAELIGALYLPGSDGAAVVAVTAPGAAAITARNDCDAVGPRSCDTAMVSP